MIALREFPPNPHAVVYHLDERLTDQIVETYSHGSPAPHAWAMHVAALPGLRVLSMNAYKIRVQKEKRAAWSELLVPLETLLRNELGLHAIEELVESETRLRKFAWPGEAFERKVFEGRLQAQGHPVASALFELRGVAEVILDRHHVQVRKCPLHSWRDLAPLVQEILSEA